jgi:cytochrome b561
MIRNTLERWGWPTRALHWIVAAMVLGLFAHGLLIDEFGRDQRLYQIWLHSAVGITLLLIVVVAFVWWITNPVPAEPAGTPVWQGRAAHLAHWGLYALIFAVTLSGWVLTGTMSTPVSVDLFGFIGVPQLASPGSGYHEFLEEAHELLANVLIALVAVHVAAALYHHFVVRDGVLLRMLGRELKPKPESR